MNRPTKSSGKKINRGFTLVELVIVVSILAILIGLLAPQYTKYVEKSRKAADVSNLDEMAKAIQIALVDAEYDLVYGEEVGVIKVYITDLGSALTCDLANEGEVQRAIKDYTGYYLPNVKIVFNGGTLNEQLRVKSRNWKLDDQYPVSDAASGIYVSVTMGGSAGTSSIEYSPNVEEYFTNEKS